MKLKDGRTWAKGKSKLAYAPTTLTTLAALVPPELEADIKIFDEGVDSVPADFEADLLGISVITPNAPRAYKIADEARKRGITVVLGGYHPTILPDEAAQHADAVVCGYAEKAWPKLLLDYSAGKMKKIYREPSHDVFSQIYTHARRDLLKKRGYIFSKTLEATRGCKNLCTYCIIPTTSNRSYIQRDITDIVNEVKAMKAKNIVFLDSSLSEDLAYTKKLFKALIPLKIGWYGNITLKALQDREWIELAARSGCRGVLIGFESINQDSLNEQKKTFNRVDEYALAIQKLREHKILIVGCFVFGFDSDDVGIFKRTISFIEKNSIDLAYFGIYIPFPSTPGFEKLQNEKRILTNDWSLYDGHHVVFEPERMRPEELLNGLRFAWKKNYTFSAIIKRVLRSPSRFFVKLIVNLGYRQYVKSISVEHES